MYNTTVTNPRYTELGMKLSYNVCTVLSVPTVRVTSITSTSISLTHHHFCISQYSLDVLTFTTPSFLYSPLTATQPDCQTDNTAAVTGWVVAVVFIITTVAAVCHCDSGSVIKESQRTLLNWNTEKV